MPPGRPGVLTPASFKPISEAAQDRGLTALFYSPPGSGKTTLAASIMAHPKVKRALLLEFDVNGIESIKDVEGIDVFRPSKSSQVKDVIRFLRKSDDYQAVITDTVTQWQHIAVRERSPDLSKPVPLQVYGAINAEIAAEMGMLRDLATDRGLHVIFTAHEKEQKDEKTGAVLYRPDLTPGLASKVYGMLNAVGRITSNRGGKRTLEFNPRPHVQAKFRQVAGGAVPLAIPLIKEDIGSEKYGLSYILTCMGH